MFRIRLMRLCEREYTWIEVRFLMPAYLRDLRLGIEHGLCTIPYNYGVATIKTGSGGEGTHPDN